MQSGMELQQESPQCSMGGGGCQAACCCLQAIATDCMAAQRGRQHSNLHNGLQRCLQESLLACRLLCSRTGRVLALPSRATIVCRSRCCCCCLPPAAWLARQVTITTDTTQECTSSLLPITYPKFPAMCEVRTRCLPCPAVLSCCWSDAAGARYAPLALLVPYCCSHAAGARCGAHLLCCCCVLLL